VSLEAEINGAPMVFPMGPDLYLSWASCTATISTDGEKSTAYRCELKRAIVSEVSYGADLAPRAILNGGFRTGHADQEELVGRWILSRE